MSDVDLLAAPDTIAVSRAVDAYAAILRNRYGASLKGIYLFGSRARGDFDPYSDVDVAIVLDDSAERPSETKSLSELAYDIFLQTGAEIQPWIFQEAEWRTPEHSPSAGLIRAARRDSRPVTPP